MTQYQSPPPVGEITPRIALPSPAEVCAVRAESLPTTSVRPRDDFVLVLRDKAEEKSPGGLHLPQQTQEAERPARGSVLAEGPGKLLESGARAPLDLPRGARVIFGKYAGILLDPKQPDWLFLRGHECYATED